MGSVTLSNLRKVYAGGQEAVRGVSFDVADGTFCVLVGPSGCGKSTLLRMIAGLETVSSGTVAIDGRTVNDVEPADRDIAMVFQNYALYPHMRVRDNLAYGLRNRKTPKPEIETRVAEAARILGLGEMLDRYPRQLSGGQRQRVAMGRAIVRKPQVFLFDEPLSNLDAKLRVQMRVEIKRLQRSLGVTAVYVTHDQVEAMTLSDQLVVMSAGRVEQVGTAIEIYRRPMTRFVATFIGSPPMNILAGTVEPGGIVALPEGGRVTVPAAAALAPGTPVEVGIRPEEATRRAADGASLRMRVDFAEELGATRLLHGKLGGQDFIVQTQLLDQAADGDAIGLSVEPSAVHLFDPGTGHRID